MQKSTKLFLLLSCAVLCIGLFVRLYHFQSNPRTLYIDEMAMLVDAKSILATGEDIHGKPWWQPIYLSYGDYKQPLYTWLAAPALWLFGQAQWVVRVPSLFAGLCTLLLAPFITLELWRWKKPGKYRQVPLWNWYSTNKWLGLAVFGVVAVSPWAITFSRTGFEGHVAQALFAAGIYTALLASKNGWWRVLSILFLALSTYTYYSVRFVAPVMYASVSAIQLWQQIQLSSAHKKVFTRIVTGVSITIILPLLLYFGLLTYQSNSEFSDEAQTFRLGTDSVLNSRGDYVLMQNSYREIAGNTTVDRVLFHRSVLLLKELGAHYSDFLNFQYLFLNGDANLRHGTGGHGLFLLPFILPFLWGSYELLKRRKSMAIILFLWWLLAVLPAAVPDTTPHALRSLNALVPLASIIGVGVYAGAIWIQRNYHKLIIKIATLVWITAVLISLIEFQYFYHVPYQKLSADAWFAQDQQLLEMIAELNTEGVPVYIWGGNARVFLWIAGQPSYSAQHLVQDRADALFSNDYLYPKIANFTIVQGMPSEHPQAPVILVLPTAQWAEVERALEPYATETSDFPTQADSQLRLVKILQPT